MSYPWTKPYPMSVCPFLSLIVYKLSLTHTNSFISRTIPTTRVQLADKIRPAISKFDAPIPAVLEIPSKEHPYDASKDSILQRVRGMLGPS